MSYILDALRKSDEQRRRGATPTLLTPQAAAVAPEPRKSLPYGLVAVALVGAGVVIGALRPWQTEPRAPATASSPVARPPVAAPEASRTAPSASLQAAREPVQKPQPVAKPPQPVAKPAPIASEATRRTTRATGRNAARSPESEPEHETVAAVPREVTKSTAKSASASRTADSAKEPPVVMFSELPLPIQQEMPRMSINVHAYSAVPRERLVGINERVLREGESVTPDLKLEQITPDGMIMTYKGYRFRRGVR